MASTIRVVGIFTNGARSSATAEERQARFNNDLTLANAAWGTGFAPGVSCGLRFASLRIFYHPDVTIDESTVSNVNDPRVANLITQARTTLNDATAIYVVYLSGDSLSPGSIGNGGPEFTFFRGTTDYGLIGRVVLSGRAIDTYAFAHEAGHVLFGRFLDNSNPGSFTINDPSNPGSAHSNNPQNLMYPIIPSSDPIINSAQCSVAKQSKVIAQNAASSYLKNKKLGSARKKNNRPMVKKLNNTLTAKMRRMKPDVSRRRRTAKVISKARKPCCRPAANRRRTLKRR